MWKGVKCNILINKFDNTILEKFDPIIVALEIVIENSSKGKVIY